MGLRAQGTFLALLLAAGPAWTDAADFDKSFEKTRRLVRKGRWEEGKKRLAGLLEEHANQPYARARRAEIAELMKQCVFNEEYGEIDERKAVEDFVDGEILAYSSKTGRLHVRYGPGQRKDFEKMERGGYFHNAAFKGPHRISIRGSSYPGDGVGPVVSVCWDGDAVYQVIFGVPEHARGNTIYYMPAQITRYAGDNEEQLAFKEKTNAKAGKRFLATVKVTATKIVAYYNNKSFLSGRKGSKDWGHFAISPNCGDCEIILDGVFEPSWIQGHLDALNQKRWAEFEKTYKETDHLPAWLTERAGPDATLARSDGRVWPEALDDAGRTDVTRLMKFYGEGKLADGMRFLEAGTALPDATLHYLRARFLQALGDPEAALAECLRIVELDADFAEARILEASLYADLRRSADAQRVYDELLEKYPGDADLHAAATSGLVALAEFRKARAVLRRAIGNGLASPLLAQTSRLLAKAEHGPAWPRSFEKKSKHYHVISDIDKETCYEASRILESAYIAYIYRLERVEDAEEKLFRVYLFSGQDGFNNYSADVLGVTVPSAAGLYSPNLRQLLIWNVPRREDMIRTVRHEGFHQYLNRVMGDPPLWFNEGLAEYYEEVDIVGGAFKFGQVRPDHLRILEEGTIPLETFLYESHATFMATAYKHYAQAWAFIHFLRHTNRENRLLFERFWEAFKTIPAQRKAVEHALEGRAVRVLDVEFQRHLDDLRRGS